MTPCPTTYTFRDMPKPRDSGRTGSGSNPKPGSVFEFSDRTEPNRHQRSGKTVDSNRTETLVPALRSTRTRRFRPPDQPEPVGSDLPINPNPSVAANRIHRSQPDTLGVTPRVKPIRRRFHPRFHALSSFPPNALSAARSSREKQTAYFAQPSVQPCVQRICTM